MKSKRLAGTGRTLVVSIITGSLLIVGALAWAEAPRAELLWGPAQVADASDRAYEPVAISLIDGATSSVVLAMYLIQDSQDARHPVNRLLQDLVEAAHRGVRVEIYLNTRFAARDERRLAAPWVARLRQAGVTVAALSEGRRWHGKLLIVDERYVLEGSTNWSVAALESNGESNTVMDAPALARQKLARVRAQAREGMGTTAGKKGTVPQVDNPFLVAGPDAWPLPVVWLARDGVFSQCVTRGDERGFDALVLMIRRGGADARAEFAVDLDRLSDALGLSARWSRTHRRQEVLQVLRRLSRRTGVVALHLNPHREAWVRVETPEGPAVTLPSVLTAPDRLARQSAAATYLALLTEMVRQQEGIDLATVAFDALIARTGLAPKTLRRARRELATSFST